MWPRSSTEYLAIYRKYTEIAKCTDAKKRKNAQYLDTVFIADGKYIDRNTGSTSDQDNDDALECHLQVRHLGSRFYLFEYISASFDITAATNQELLDIAFRWKSNEPINSIMLSYPKFKTYPLYDILKKTTNERLHRLGWYDDIPKDIFLRAIKEYGIGEWDPRPKTSYLEVDITKIFESPPPHAEELETEIVTIFYDLCMELPTETTLYAFDHYAGGLRLELGRSHLTPFGHCWPISPVSRECPDWPSHRPSTPHHFISANWDLAWLGSGARPVIYIVGEPWVTAYIDRACSWTTHRWVENAASP